MILIEGKIGVGKTTLGAFLETQFRIPLCRELGNVDTMQILRDFYAEKKRWGFLSQVHFLAHRFSMIMNLQNSNSLAFLDRSMFGDSIFAELLYEEGHLTKEEFNTYKILLDDLLKLTPPPKYLIYLNCSVEVAMKRISNRDRDCERTMSLDYMKKLHVKYYSWYQKYDCSPKLFIETDHINILSPQGKNYMLQLLEYHLGKMLLKDNLVNRIRKSEVGDFLFKDCKVCS